MINCRQTTIGPASTGKFLDPLPQNVEVVNGGGHWGPKGGVAGYHVDTMTVRDSAQPPPQAPPMHASLLRLGAQYRRTPASQGGGEAPHVANWRVAPHVCSKHCGSACSTAAAQHLPECVVVPCARMRLMWLAMRPHQGRQARATHLQQPLLTPRLPRTLVCPPTHTGGQQHLQELRGCCGRLPRRHNDGA